MNVIVKNIVYHTPWLLSDRKFIELFWQAKTGGVLNLDHPSTFNEKVNWLKLNDRNPVYTKLVDKAEVKKYVASLLGGEYVIPTLGVWEDFDDIDFNSLPAEGFVMKCTHDSGSVEIVRDKADMDMRAVRKKFKAALSSNYYWKFREWPYRNVPARIIAEPYLSDPKGQLNDYKFFCSHGKVRFLFIATQRFARNNETRFDFFDRDFNHLPLTNGHPLADQVPTKPDNFEKMIEVAEKLSADFPFVRVDLYDLKDRILFGEFTFSHWGGFKPFEPQEWDRKLGDLIEL